MMLNLFIVLERERFYSNMVFKDEKNWRYYSAALVLFQRDFVIERPALVKSLIRLVKYWRKTFFPRIVICPPIYWSFSQYMPGKMQIVQRDLT